MSIQEIYTKFKGACTNPEILLAALIVVVGMSSFALGRLSVSGEIPIPEPKIEARTQPRVPEVVNSETILHSSTTVNSAAVVQEKTGYVASKSGTKYHLPWCGSASQIKEENKIWFATKEEAEKAGYTPAANCKGI